jgi:hypothetical protein
MPECRSCHAQIIFMKSLKTGRVMPLDALPNPQGNCVIVEVEVDGNKEPRVTVAHSDPDDDGVAISDDDNPYRGKRFMSHFVTCTHADKYRKT